MSYGLYVNLVVTKEEGSNSLLTTRYCISPVVAENTGLKFIASYSIVNNKVSFTISEKDLPEMFEFLDRNNITGCKTF